MPSPEHSNAERLLSTRSTHFSLQPVFRICTHGMFNALAPDGSTVADGWNETNLPSVQRQKPQVLS